MSNETKVTVEEVEAPVAVETKKRKSNASVAIDKFDWDAFEQDTDYGVSKEVVEAAYAETLSSVIENEVVEGTVVAVNKREVLVNIGYKSEGIIAVSEFRYNPELAKIAQKAIKNIRREVALSDEYPMRFDYEKSHPVLVSDDFDEETLVTINK